MSVYLNTLGKNTLAIAICDRCHTKYPYDALKRDGNSPGLLVCTPCWDKIDPWRLPFTPADANITLQHPRPDTDIALTQCYVVNSSGEVVDGACPVDTSVRVA